MSPVHFLLYVGSWSLVFACATWWTVTGLAARRRRRAHDWRWLP